MKKTQKTVADWMVQFYFLLIPLILLQCITIALQFPFPTCCQKIPTHYALQIYLQVLGRNIFCHLYLYLNNLLATSHQNHNRIMQNTILHPSLYSTSLHSCARTHTCWRFLHAPSLGTGSKLPVIWPLASGLIRLSSLNDATCAVPNAPSELHKLHPLKCKSTLCPECTGPTQKWESQTIVVCPPLPPPDSHPPPSPSLPRHLSP